MRRLAILLLCLACAFAPARARSFPGTLDTASVRRVADAVASWQMDHYPEVKYKSWEWTVGALYRGLYEWAELQDDGRIFAFLKNIGDTTAWACGPRAYHADDICVGQTFIKMAQRYGDPAMMQPTLDKASWVVAHPSSAPLSFADKKGRSERWSWCDALFMAAPVYAQLYGCTGDRAFLDFLDKEYKTAVDSLFYAPAGLFFRDCLRIPKREKNGQQQFWGRGNGWVFAGLGLIIDALPKGCESRKFYIDIFKKMARAVAETQGADGSWRASLLCPEFMPDAENSASAFFCYGLAWGLRNGYLPRREYADILRKGWDALTGYVSEDGLLGYVQPMGAAPGGRLGPQVTEVYGVGAFLLAASEVWRICEEGKAEGLLSGKQLDGYKGIWFNLGQESPYGFKYSGGLGTYTVKHNPMGVYAPEVDRTYFVYGGTTGKDETHLLCMIGCYDHKTRKVQRPVCVFDKEGVSDPHDNPALQIDKDGYLWVFVSGRASGRLGHLYRSEEPYDIHRWRHIRSWIMTYPQPLYSPEHGFLLNYTRYDGVRRLYWSTSPDGTVWSPYRGMADIRGGSEKQSGHYEVTGYDPAHDKLFVTFNRHIGGNCDLRTNIYFLQSTDWGKTWTTADGTEVKVPVQDRDDISRILDAESQKKNIYIKDVNYDAEGNPVILYVSSGGAAPGPANDPRTWSVAWWNGRNWIFRDITTSHHNYDSGSIYVEGKTWTVIGPTEDGPQFWGAGGEVALWRSTNQGRSWKKVADLTSESPYNMGYCRRPYRAAPGFWCWWADGNPDRQTKSTLYFCTKDGDVFVLPYEKMKHEWERPLPYKRK